MDNLRHFPRLGLAEDETGFTVRDASGFHICRIPHREDLHARGYQYADQHLNRDEARRIAKAISQLPDLLKRPQY